MRWRGNTANQQILRQFRQFQTQLVDMHRTRQRVHDLAAAAIPAMSLTRCFNLTTGPVSPVSMATMAADRGSATSSSPCGPKLKVPMDFRFGLPC